MGRFQFLKVILVRSAGRFRLLGVSSSRFPARRTNLAARQITSGRTPSFSCTLHTVA